MGPIGPREGSQKSPKPPNLGGPIGLPGRANSPAWGQIFYKFDICLLGYQTPHQTAPHIAHHTIGISDAYELDA